MQFSTGAPPGGQYKDDNTSRIPQIELNLCCIRSSYSDVTCLSPTTTGLDDGTLQATGFAVDDNGGTRLHTAPPTPTAIMSDMD